MLTRPYCKFLSPPFESPRLVTEIPCSAEPLGDSDLGSPPLSLSTSLYARDENILLSFTWGTNDFATVCFKPVLIIYDMALAFLGRLVLKLSPDFSDCLSDVVLVVLLSFLTLLLSGAESFSLVSFLFGSRIWIWVSTVTMVLLSSILKSVRFPNDFSVA